MEYSNMKVGNNMNKKKSISKFQDSLVAIREIAELRYIKPTA